MSELEWFQIKFSYFFLASFIFNFTGDLEVVIRSKIFFTDSFYFFQLNFFFVKMIVKPSVYKMDIEINSLKKKDKRR